MENSPQLLLEQQPLADRTQRIEFQVRVYAAIMNPKTIWRQNSSYSGDLCIFSQGR
jgi:hypothetical protein